MTALSRQFFYNAYTPCDDVYSLASFIKVHFFLHSFLLACVFILIFIFYQRWYMRLPQRLFSKLSIEDIERISSEPVETMRVSLNTKFSDKLYQNRRIY